jgi:hypothetical protein
VRTFECRDVSSSQDDRKPLCEQLASRLESEAAIRPSDERDAFRAIPHTGILAGGRTKTQRNCSAIAGHLACTLPSLITRSMTPNTDRHQPCHDRRHAGTLLAAQLGHFKDRGDVVVLALPRGGVPGVHEVAHSLDAPLDVFLVRKLGVPGHRELAMGAIAAGGVRLLNDDGVSMYGLPEAVSGRSRSRRLPLESCDECCANTVHYIQVD